MRIFFNTSDDAPTHSLPATNAVGETVVVNGQWFLNMPTGAHHPVTAGDTAAGLVTSVFNAQRDAFPMYNFVTANALHTAASLALLDQTSQVNTLPAPFNGNTYRPRFQSGDPAVGTVGGCTALLPTNTLPGTDAVGLIQTKNIDISGDVPLGTDTVTVYWDIWTCSTTHDIHGTGVGAWANTNSPAQKTWTRADPNVHGFYCYVSVDNGVTYTEATWLQPQVLPAPGTDLRLCFVNDTATKYHLLAYSVLYGNR